MQTCSKVRHSNIAHAIIAIAAQPHKCLAPYACKRCSGWHLTQNKRGNRFFQNFIDRVRDTDREKGRP